MNRETLKKYAEAGVRERLREIQRELEDMARDFPHIVRNADGAMPSVLPVVVSKRQSGKPLKAHRAKSPKSATKRSRKDTIELARAYLSKHPGATTAQISDALGYATRTQIAKLLPSLAKSAKGDGARAGFQWFLRAPVAKAHANGSGSGPVNGSGKPAKPSKIRTQREAAAAFLAQFDATTPKPSPPGKASSMGVYVRRGYLRQKDDGYIRTAKEFTV